jgi:hypothetical protein
MSETKPGADIVADAREWLARYGGRETTHSDGCHRWHDACLIARLVAECESRTGSIDAKAGAEATEVRSHGEKLPERERVANHPANPDSSTLTDEERQAVEWAAAIEPEPSGRWTKAQEAAWNQRAATLRALLERRG